MDRLLKAEKKLILGMCKKIKKAGCNVLLMQKSILRDATTALSRHYLSKMKIMVVTDVERSDIEFITRVRSGLCSVVRSCVFTSLRALLVFWGNCLYHAVHAVCCAACQPDGTLGLLGLFSALFDWLCRRSDANLWPR